MKQTYDEQMLINKKCRLSIIRPQVRYIVWSDEFDEILSSDMFVNTFITHLIFGFHYDQLTAHLLSSTTHLTFDWHYNQLTDHLPSSITHLTFGGSYNQPFIFCNLQSLTHLTFGKHFNQRLDVLSFVSSLMNLYLHESYKLTNYPLPSTSFSLPRILFYLWYKQKQSNLIRVVLHKKWLSTISIFVFEIIVTDEK
jgi:hypothetical protein